MSSSESMNIVDELLNSTHTFKFDNIGDMVKGVIIEIGKQQQTDFKTKRPLFWDDGNPRMQYVYRLKTDLNEKDDDDGIRVLYAKGQMQKAIKDAIVVTKCRNDQVLGGMLAVKYVEDGIPPQVGLNPPKLFVAQFEPGSGGNLSPSSQGVSAVSSDDLF